MTWSARPELSGHSTSRDAVIEVLRPPCARPGARPSIRTLRYLKDIYASCTHLLSLINDILDLSEIEAGRKELELTDFDLPTGGAQPRSEPSSRIWLRAASLN